MRSLLLLVALTAGLGGCVFDSRGLPVESDGMEILPVQPAWTGDSGAWLITPPSPTNPGTISPADTAEVMLCHTACSTPKTLSVDPSAVSGHLGHGDYLGRCAP